MRIATFGSQNGAHGSRRSSRRRHWGGNAWLRVVVSECVRLHVIHDNSMPGRKRRESFSSNCGGTPLLQVEEVLVLLFVVVGNVDFHFFGVTIVVSEKFSPESGEKSTVDAVVCGGSRGGCDGRVMA